MKMTIKFGFSALRIAVLALCTGVAGVALHAQDTPPGPPPGGGQMGGRGGDMQKQQLERMTKELSLTPDQVTGIKAIQDEGRAKMMAMRNDTSSQDGDRRQKMMAMREAETAKIKALLTDDQKVKFDAMQAKQRERQRERQGDGGGPPPPPPSN